MYVSIGYIIQKVESGVEVRWHYTKKLLGFQDLSHIFRKLCWIYCRNSILYIQSWCVCVNVIYISKGWMENAYIYVKICTYISLSFLFSNVKVKPFHTELRLHTFFIYIRIDGIISIYLSTVYFFLLWCVKK